MSEEELKVHVSGESGEIVLKVIVIGDGSVGKTSLLKQYIQKQFQQSYLPTVGVNISKQPKKYKGFDVNLMFWDIAGQPQFYLLHKVYYNGANAALLVFDLTQSHTFSNIKNWYNELIKYGLKDIPMILVGNKNDLKKERKIIPPMAENLQEQLGIPLYYETSALNGENVNTVFEKIIEMHLKRMGKI